jgi:hypothetical protein
MTSNGRKPTNATLTPAKVRWIRRVYRPRDRKWGQPALAKKLGVTQMAISHVLSGKTWAGVK